MIRILIVTVMAFCLGACAGGGGSSSSTRSGVQVYGTIDTGIGSQSISR